MSRTAFALIISTICLNFSWAQSIKPIRVALYSDKGISSSSEQLQKGLNSYTDLKVTLLNAQDIAEGKLSGFDLLIQPGGSGGAQGKALGEKGRDKVREFVKNGGGYLGICAGAYLATCDYEWSLNILDAKVLDRKHWARGFGNVEIKLSPEARKILGVETEKETIYYHQGPLQPLKQK
jgi:putative intracellular protease/amidase